ncbi:MAG TPA: hypothetical protein VGO43_00320 [Pyrinomonadaceae bacterium]|jgi:hypothetical protein|nr:hypothetical protein [Pyrinomonadaceae bacterium]
MRRSLAIAILVFGLLASGVTTARAYDNDTHFWFTYYLAVKAGYTPVQASQIASADVSVDYDDDTQPVLPSIESFGAFRHPLDHFQYVRNRLHALPMKSEIIRLANLPSGYWWDPLVISDPKVLAVARQIVADRKAEFWRDTLRDGRNPGIFLHYLEDTFAHDGFASYIGHAGYYRIDYMASDRTKAERMAFTALKYLIAFREVAINGKPAEKFADPENINLILYFNPAKTAEIRAGVQRFADANPSTGSEPNDLIKEWTKLNDKDRHDRNNVPPPTFVRPFYIAAKDGPSPDSARAREVALSVFNLRRDQLPLIWVYNLKDTGVPEDDTADEAYVYKERDLSRFPKKFDSDDEKANKDKKKIFDTAGKRECMPFKLVEPNVISVPLCSAN